MKIVLSIMLTVLLTACASTEATPSRSSNPEWVDELIATMQTEPVGNPPQEIYRYQYQGHTVYYVPAQCCDQFSTLYDDSGETICAPDGGITGKGDGTCMDFFEQATNEALVWRDSRSR